MIHPLLNLKDLSDEELQKKLQNIQKRLMNSHMLKGEMIQQMRAIFESIQEEQKERQVQKAIKEDPNLKAGVVVDTEESIEKEKDDLDVLIDIN